MADCRGQCLRQALLDPDFALLTNTGVPIKGMLNYKGWVCLDGSIEYSELQTKSKN